MILGRYLGTHTGPQEQISAVKALRFCGELEGGRCLLPKAFIQSRQQNGVKQGGSLTFFSWSRQTNYFPSSLRISETIFKNIPVSSNLVWKICANFYLELKPFNRKSSYQEKKRSTKNIFIRNKRKPPCLYSRFIWLEILHIQESKNVCVCVCVYTNTYPYKPHTHINNVNLLFVWYGGWSPHQIWAW